VRLVVSTPGPDLERLRRACAEIAPRVELVVSPRRMPELMSWADLALSASGSTTWELLFLGLPALLVALSEDQRRLSVALAGAGAAIDLGWHADIQFGALAATLGRLAHDPRRRQQLSECGRGLVDGRGAQRVAALLAGEGE
jgi:spore coat polysaccharide biosynthesis predicted glycosyltransferase SpsG